MRFYHKEIMADLPLITIRENADAGRRLPEMVFIVGFADCRKTCKGSSRSTEKRR